jgi:pimeloyl-ACP methyl ester carboxylesterase
MLLNAIVSGPDDPAQTPAILIHGLFGQARNLGRLQRRLALTRRTLAVDLRSHGDSPHGPLDLRAMGDDVRETMRGRGIDRGVIIGHSLGGKVSMALALDHSDAVARLLVADIAPAAYQHGNIRYARALQALELHPGLTRAEADAALAASIEEPSVRTLLLQNLATGERPRWRIGLDDIAGSLDQAEGWPDWSEGTSYAGPALFLRAENSDFVLPEHTPAIRSLFPRARMATLRDAGHWLHVDKPEDFNEIVMSFVGAERPGALPLDLDKG